MTGQRDTDRIGVWPSGSMMAAVINGPGAVGLTDVAIPHPVPGEALISVDCIGICGTDLELLHGTARYVRDGRTAFPHVFGHEWCGTVVAVCGSDQDVVGQRVVGHTMLNCGMCVPCQRGTRNKCERLREVGLYGQQGAAASYLRMPVRSLTAVPDSVHRHAAVLVEPAVTVLAACAEAAVSRTDHVAVLGSGTIGLLAVQALSGRAARTDVIGIDEQALELANALGATEVFKPGKASRRDYSVVVEASGAVDAFREGLDLLGVGGRMAAVGVPDRPVDSIDANRLVLDGITVRGIRHGLDHYQEALTLFEYGVLNATSMIDREFPLEKAEEAFGRLEHGARRSPKVLLAPAAAR